MHTSTVINIAVLCFLAMNASKLFLVCHLNKPRQYYCCKSPRQGVSSERALKTQHLGVFQCRKFPLTVVFPQHSFTIFFCFIVHTELFTSLISIYDFLLPFVNFALFFNYFFLLLHVRQHTTHVRAPPPHPAISQNLLNSDLYRPRVSLQY